MEYNEEKSYLILGGKKSKNVKERVKLSKKYFIFLGKRTKEKNEYIRKKMKFTEV